MTQPCPHCDTLNPSDAVYCFRDGTLLPAKVGGDAPRDPSKQPFPSPLILSNGHACANFDQLAFACEAHWPIVLDALKEGFLARFFEGIGRSDLAVAARDAAQFPDADRGLDRLIGQLPTNVLEPAFMTVSRTEIHVGPLTVGRDYQIKFGIENKGMRLLYGSIASDAEWLSPVANATGYQRLFQCRSETEVTLFIGGKKLRAGAEAMIANLTVESNGGTATIRVIAQVPIKRFEHGTLTGADSPRRIVEFAQQQPDQAAQLFEDGAVERWYNENGWTYPVRLPRAGAAAADQFLQALGLGKPPEVRFDEQSIQLQGKSNATVEHRMRLQTADKSQLFATGESDQPWLTVAPADLQGHVAFLPLRVDRIPNQPGKLLYARVRVRTNGNQQFDIPVTLRIEASNGSAAKSPPPAAVPVAVRLPAKHAQAVPNPVPAPNAKQLPRAIIVTQEMQTAPRPYLPFRYWAFRRWKLWTPIGVILLVLLIIVMWFWLR